MPVEMNSVMRERRGFTESRVEQRRPAIFRGRVHVCDNLALTRNRQGGSLRVANVSHLRLAVCVTYLILTYLNLFLLCPPDLGTHRSTFYSSTSRTYLYLPILIPDNSFFNKLPVQHHDMPRKFTSVNGRTARAAVAGPSHVRRTQKKVRKAPQQPDFETMQKFVIALREGFANNGGNVDIPCGITDQNSVIANIVRDGVPEALSNVGNAWTDDEYDFIWFTQEWQHGRIAAYLGRTEQACRLIRTRLKKIRSPTQQDTEDTQDEPLQNPPAVSSASSASSDSSASSATSAPSGAPDSSVAIQRSDQLYQMPIVALTRFRAFPLAPMEPATSTTLDVQAAATRDSAPASNVISESGLNILASAAAQAEQRRAPYQHALSVMEHDVD